MKTSRWNLLRNLTLAVAAFTLMVSTVPYSTAETRKTTLTHQELVELIANAKTEADHQRIAEYYSQEALRLNRQAKEHLELAAVYAKNPATVESKQGNSFGQSASHCKRAAALATEEAQEDEALAEFHSNKAKAVTTK